MPDNQNEVKKLRLNKAIAEAGICSRRKADELIASEKVLVNGAVVTEMGLRVTPGKDSIVVNGVTLNFTCQKQIFSYIMLNKPVHVVSTSRDPEGRPTVLDLLPESHKNKRLYPVGRLDYFSEGAILLTDDGELTNRLTHPRFHIPKTYQVTLREKPDEKMLKIMRSGMVLAEGEKLAPVEAEILQEHMGSIVLKMVLRQGINRQIRRMCRDLGLTILKLTRVAFGPVALGELPPGQCRELTAEEVEKLRKEVQL